jgi:hypothetical protein
MKRMIVVLIAAVAMVGMVLPAVAAITSTDLLRESYREGAIDRESYVVQSLMARFAPHRIPPHLASLPPGLGGREVTLLLEEAQEILPVLSAEDRAWVTMLLKRPDDVTYNWPWDANPDFYLPAPVSTWVPPVADYPTIGDKFKFWYVTHNTADGAGHIHKTTLDFVKKMASSFETVYKGETSTLSYAVPPDDPGGATYGGDTKFDIYVMNCGFGSVYGYVSREGLSSGNSYYSFMVMDNDFTEFVTPTQTAEQAMQVTAAHEYHHAVQNGINGLADSWYKETTSTWIEDQIYDAIDDNLQYLNGKSAEDFFYNPERSMDDPDMGYAHWIFNEYLETKWDQATVKAVWDQLDPDGKNNALDAIAAMLATKAVSARGEEAEAKTWKDAFTEFATKNYAQKGFYKDADKYDEVPFFKEHTLDFSGANTHKVDWQTITVNNLAAKYYKFKPGALTKPTILNIKVDGADGKDVNAVAVVKKKDGTFQEYPFTLSATKKEGDVGIPQFYPDKVTEVFLVLVNHSKAEDNLEIKYYAELEKAFTFVIDATGSMGSEIGAAVAAAKAVLDSNKAKGIKRFYTVMAFWDGAPSVIGASSDEEVVKGYLNTLYASGGAGCPESSLLSIRRAADLAENSDIMMMTDASSNSYGVDDTYATWAEVFETIAKLAATNSKLNSIVYSSCTEYATASAGEWEEMCRNEAEQCPGCFGAPAPKVDLEGASHGLAGYYKASTDSGGLYFKVSTWETTTAAQMIMENASADSTIAFYDGNGAASFDVPVDPSVTLVTFFVNGDPGSALSLVVRNPSGTVVTGSTTGVTVTTLGTTVQYTVIPPALATGTWTASVSGTGAYRFSAKAATTNPMTYSGNSLVQLGQRLNMSARVESTVPGIDFELVDTVDGTVVPLALTTTDNLLYTGSRVMNDTGTYRFRATGNSSFQRMYEGKISVNALKVVAPKGKHVISGDTFTYVFTIKNLGSKRDTFDLAVTSSRGWANTSSIPAEVTIPGNSSTTIRVPMSPYAYGATATDITSLAVSSQRDDAVNAAVSVTTTALPYPSVYDKFDHGNPDYHWTSQSGRWAVTRAKNFMSSATKNNLATVSTWYVYSMGQGRIRGKFKLTSAFRKVANFAVVLDFQDKTHYRYVQFQRLGRTGKVLIGQVGTLGGQNGGTKRTVRKTIPYNKWQSFNIDQLADGTIQVTLNGKAAGSYKFTSLVSGQVGVRAVTAKSILDDFLVWTYIPGLD